MFGCQKPAAASSNPPANAVAPTAGQGAPSATGLIPTTPAMGESSINEQLLTTDRQTLAPGEQTTSPKGQQASTNTPENMSVPALRSSISFANALPPIPVGVATQQAQSRGGAVNIHPDQRSASQQRGAATAAVIGRSLSAQQQVHASVSDWLLRQGSGEVQQTSIDGSGGCLMDLATGDEDEGSQAAGSSGASDDDAAGTQVTPCLQVTSCLQVTTCLQVTACFAGLCLCKAQKLAQAFCGAANKPAFFPCVTCRLLRTFPVCVSHMADHASMKQQGSGSACELCTCDLSFAYTGIS